MVSPHCYQVNLQTGWGGGEVYTVFFTRALISLGIETTLYVHPDNPHWRTQLPPETRVVALANGSRGGAQLNEIKSGWFVFHSSLAPDLLANLRDSNRLLSCIAHMPLYGRNPERLAAHDLVIGVSEHVLDSLRAAGIHHYYQEALLGIADLSKRGCHDGDEVYRTSRYDWDRRKGRDRLFGWFEPFIEAFRSPVLYHKEDGITLGIVSRITPIKQFPLLFSLLSPVLARHPGFRLEVFGAGGYASVRDLDRALRPIKDRVRFWGHQSDVARVYRGIDYLLTGLPEKEALGLNVIEAQRSGTPVLAVGSRPFTETVAENVTGLFFNDPRHDQAAGFESLLVRLEETPFVIDSVSAANHLEKFSEHGFAQRLARLYEVVRHKICQ